MHSWCHMYKIRQVKHIAKVPGLLSHFETTWGTNHQTWASSQSWLWVVFDESEWVAYGNMYVYGQEQVCVGPTFVKRDYRGQGLQVKLLKRRLRFAKKLGYKTVYSCTYMNNFPSINNLIKTGFSLIRCWISADSDGIDCCCGGNCLHWQKDI